MANFLVTTPFNDSFWSKSWHEPLIFAIIFPLHSVKPWKLREIDILVECERELQEVWERISVWEGIFCANFTIHENIGSHAKGYGAEAVIVRQKRRGL